MNILSLILTILAAAVFALTAQGHRYATISVGLVLLTCAWVLQLLWASANPIAF